MKDLKCPSYEWGFSELGYLMAETTMLWKSLDEIWPKAESKTISKIKPQCFWKGVRGTLLLWNIILETLEV